MDKYEYMKTLLEIIPDEMTQKYKLQDLAQKGFVNTEIKRRVCTAPRSQDCK